MHSGCDWKSMTTKLPTSSVLSLSFQRHSKSNHSCGVVGSSRGPGVWTGTREGLVSTVVACAAALVFGGAAGV